MVLIATRRAGILAPDAGIALNDWRCWPAWGFAEELLFRGWLWGSLELNSSPHGACCFRAVISPLIHPWYRTEGPGAIGQLAALIHAIRDRPGLASPYLTPGASGERFGAAMGAVVGRLVVLQMGLIELSAGCARLAERTGCPQPNPDRGAIGCLGLVCADLGAAAATGPL